jgi:hypothetical protein
MKSKYNRCGLTIAKIKPIFGKFKLRVAKSELQFEVYSLNFGNTELLVGRYLLLQLKKIDLEA